MAQPKSREDADVTITKEEEKGKLLRTLIWVGVILLVILSPVVCCVGSTMLGLLGS